MSIVSDIVSRLGGIKATSDAAGVHVTRVYEWVRNDRVPQDKITRLVLHARKAGIALSVDDFFPLDDGRAA